MTPEDQDCIAMLQDDLIYNDPLYKQGFQAGAASRDAEIAELVTALEHILAGSLSLPRFAEAEAIAVIAKVRNQ